MAQSRWPGRKEEGDKNEWAPGPGLTSAETLRWPKLLWKRLAWSLEFLGTSMDVP